MTDGPGPRPFRRTRWIAAGMLAALGATFVATSPAAGAPEQTAFNNGTGTASALGYKVNPLYGNLSFGITTGLSIAGHQNTVAQGISKVYDFGVIGATLAGEGCDGGDATLAEEDQPHPLIAESRDPKYANGVEQEEDWQGIPAGVKYARATTAPFGEAITTVAPFGDKAVALITGARTTATSGVVDGNAREAKAITEIAQISFLDGVVKMGDLRWEAVQRTGAGEVAQGTFSMGSLSVGGTPVPLPQDQEGQIKALDAALTQIGFTITPPESRVEKGIVFVDPMKIGIIQSEVRDSLLGQGLNAAHDFRQQLTDALLAQDCGNATYITILDLALGTFSGAGALSLELGGVQATTAEINEFQFPELPPLGATPLPDVGGTVGDVGDTVTDIVPTDLATTDDGGGETDTGGSTQDVATAAPISQLSGARGGALAGVGGLGLALLLASAEGDRRKMRRAQREIPLEV